MSDIVEDLRVLPIDFEPRKKKRLLVDPIRVAGEQLPRVGEEEEEEEEWNDDGSEFGGI